LILVAIVLLITWLTDSQTPTQAEATRTVAAPLVLVETDDVTTSVEAPTQTLAPVPTQQQPTPEPTALPRTEVITYTIQEGDTVSSIANKIQLMARNNFMG